MSNNTDNNNNNTINHDDGLVGDPSPPSAVRNEDEDDDDSLSPENLMAFLSPYPAEDEDADDTENEDTDDAPSGLQLYAEDDEEVKPEDRPTYYVMVANGSVEGFDLAEFTDLAERANKNKIMKPTKALIGNELKRRNPELKLNYRNKKLSVLLGMLTPLTDKNEIAYVKQKVEVLKRSLLDVIEIKEAAAPPTVQITSNDRLRWTALHQYDDVLSLFWKSQDTASREELDAHETPMNKYHELLVKKFNDATVEVKFDPIPGLGYSEATVCEKGDYVLNVDKSKKISNDMRRNLNNIIDRYGRSGNGSNQHAHNRGELELDEDVNVDSLWGRTIHAQGGDDASGENETECGDDRANFLRSEPKDILVSWHIFDKLDMIRKVCGKLDESDRASSETAPRSTSRRNQSLQTPRNKRQAEEGVSPSDLDLLFLRAQKIRRLDTQEVAKKEVLNRLESQRFELYMRMEDEEKERKREMLAVRCSELSKQIEETKAELKKIKEDSQMLELDGSD